MYYNWIMVINNEIYFKYSVFEKTTTTNPDTDQMPIFLNPMQIVFIWKPEN